MTAIFFLTMVIIVVAVVALFVHDAKKAKQGGASGSSGAVQEMPTPDLPAPAPSRPQGVAPPPVDTEELAGHVAELKTAVDNDLIGREEAIASIVRQSGGNIGEDSAARLLDDADASDSTEGERDLDV